MGHPTHLRLRRTPTAGSRRRRGLAIFAAVAIAQIAVFGIVGTTAGAEEQFGAGSGRAAAKYLKVGPSRGSLSLAPTVGLALSDFLSTRGRGDVRTADFAALEDSMPPEVVTALPTVKVESSEEGAEAGRSASLGTPAEVPVGLSAAVLKASAGVAPFGRSSFETAPVDLEAVAVGGGIAEAYSGVEGGVRQAVGTVKIGSVNIGGGALVLEGLEWRAVHKSGGESVEQGTFTVGSVSVAGQRFATPPGSEQPLADALAAAQPLLGPLGIEVSLPRARIEGGVVEMTPLRIRIGGSELGQIVGPALEAAQPVRDALVDGIRGASEDADAVILLSDVALGVLAGGSDLDIELGGVTAQTAEPAQRFSFGTGGFDLSGGTGAPVNLAGSPSRPAASTARPGASSVRVPPVASTPAVSVGDGAPATGTGGRSTATVPVSSPRPDGGSGPLLLIGLGTAAAAGAAGTVDYRRLLRRPMLPA